MKIRNNLIIRLIKSLVDTGVDSNSDDDIKYQTSMLKIKVLISISFYFVGSGKFFPRCTLSAT